MDLKYDIQKYVAKTKMSARKRILVEGKDDRAHIINLLNVVFSGNNVKIDTAEGIKGDCKKTSKNNREKINKIFEKTRNSPDHNNLFFFCDREFLKFQVDTKINDFMVTHECDGNLSWSIGHSLENYFFSEDIITNAFRYLCGSELKNGAEGIFRGILREAFKIIARITLAAKIVEQARYPIGTIEWSSFHIENGLSFSTQSWRVKNPNEIANRFIEAMNDNEPIVEASESEACIRICRGHTAVVLLQRIFAACIYTADPSTEKLIGSKDADSFAKIKEQIVASALCESWLKYVVQGSAAFPTNLLTLIK